MVTAVVGLLGVLVGAVLAYEFGKRREIWVRRLNSKQDFFQEARGLLDLLGSDVDVPGDFIWARVAAARKAAYDATYFGIDPHLAESMQEITLDLARIAERTDQTSTAELTRLRQEIDRLRS